MAGRSEDARLLRQLAGDVLVGLLAALLRDFGSVAMGSGGNGRGARAAT